MKKFFLVLSIMVLSFNLWADVGYDIMQINQEIYELQILKQKKENQLNDCAKKVQGFKVAGIATLSATAVLGAVNIYQAITRVEVQDDIKKFMSDKGLNADDEFIFAQNEQVELEKEFGEQMEKGNIIGLDSEHGGNDEEWNGEPTPPLAPLQGGEFNPDEYNNVRNDNIVLDKKKSESKEVQKVVKSESKKEQKPIVQNLHKITFSQRGTASWYGGKFDGRKTASGEVFRKAYYTCAHLKLPLKSVARITNTENGRYMYVRVNDRGPYAGNRIVDVSEATAVALGFREKGLTTVLVEQ